MRKLLSLVVLTALLLMGQPMVSRADSALTLKPCTLPVGLSEPKLELPAQCGALPVSENRKDPNSRTISLNVIVLPALDATAKGLPIFHLEGGPGGSAITNFGQAWFIAYNSFRKNHPVVLIDQRGTGKSASLQCTEVTTKAIDDLAKPLTSAEDAQESITRYADCLTRLSKTNDPQYYTSADAADDMDDVRAALGYDQILVFGNSYGTWLAQYYLKLHGDHAAGTVLDSVVGPWNNPDLAAPANGQAALDKQIALCVADDLCNKQYPDLPNKLKQALDLLDKKPIETSGLSALTAKGFHVSMTKDRLRSALFELLYNSANATAIPQAITDAAAGVYTFPAALLATTAEQSDSFISLGLNLSVTCAETVPFVTDALIEQYAVDTLLFGDKTEFKKSADQQKKVCQSWRSGELNAVDVAPIKSGRPVLILSGDLDPVTPVKFGEETHSRYPNSTLVTFPYQAHGVIVNSKCAQNITAAFFDAPTSKPDTSCAPKDLKPIFLGAYSVEMAPFNDPGASFTGTAPKGWKVDNAGPVSFFASPDGLQFAAAGVYKKMDVPTAKAELTKAIQARYGETVEIQELTQSMLFISITAVAHSLDRPTEAYTGLIYLRPDFGNVIVAWQAAPSNWFQAVSLALAPQMIATTRAR